MKNGYVVEKISSPQKLPEDLDRYCDLELDQQYLVCGDACLYQIWLQKVPKFRRYQRNIFFFILYCDLDLADNNNNNNNNSGNLYISVTQSALQLNYTKSMEHIGIIHRYISNITIHPKSI